jgi:hypothetical protein
MNENQTRYSGADAEGFLVSAVRSEAEQLFERAIKFSEGRPVSDELRFIIYILNMLRLASDRLPPQERILH